MGRGIERGMTTRCALAVALCISTSELSAQQPTLRITFPENGALVYSGADLAVSVEATPEDAFPLGVALSLSPNGDIRVVRSPPYRFSVRIPPRTPPGRYSLTADGVIRPGVSVHSPSIDIQIEHLGTPLRLIPTDGPQVVVRPAGQEPPLLVTLQSIGAMREITAMAYFADAAFFIDQSTQARFTSDNTGVVTVDPKGMAKAAGPGEANIKIEYQGKSALVRVKVETSAGAVTVKDK
jgi:hypothetical protein